MAIREKHNNLNAIFSFSVFIIIASFQFHCAAQTRTELEKRKYKNLQEIEFANKLLNETEKTQKFTVSKLLVLNSKIFSRGKVILNINLEIELLNKRIEEENDIIRNLKVDLETIKGEYARLIQYAFIYQRNYNSLMYILASQSLDQLYKRLRFVQLLTSYRKRQSNAILETISTINRVLIELRDLKKDRNNALHGCENEKISLVKEKQSQSNTILKLKNKEREIREELKEKLAISRKLDNEIQNAIAAEAKKRNTKNLFSQLTPEEKLLSKNFRENKGKLPWPTETGIVINGFGDHQHPILKEVITRNHGVDISTNKDSYVRAVFDGEVSKVIAIPGTNYSVLIRHGNFLSVYQNIVNIQVKNGQKIKTKQVIGKAFGNKGDNFSIVHFEIWNEIEKQNPEDWLSSR
jgi:murein DD-endopeptidase MepM/ murein hydrolase activator NlpD